MLMSAAGPRPEPCSDGVLHALGELAAGAPVLLLDQAADRGYVVCAADRATEEFVTAASTHGRGVLRVAMDAGRLADLGLEPLRAGAAGLHAPVDLRGFERPGVHADRVATLRGLADPATGAADLVVPGCVFPVGAGDRADAADADADVTRAMVLAVRLAGCRPVAAYGEAVDEKGFAADHAATARLAQHIGLTLVTVSEVLVQAERLEPSVTRVTEASIPTRHGPLTAVGYQAARSVDEYVAFVAAPLAESTRVHVHRRCQVGDVFGGTRCGCGEQLRAALAEIQDAHSGVVVYYGDVINGPCVQGHAETSAGSWSTTVAVGSVLRDLGARQVLLSSNEPLLRRELDGLGLRVVDHQGDDDLPFPCSPRVASGT
jgi:3,4-dihydroxy 2-butanone 4-phosphate synthase/GTP cyclohydrolase II